MSEVVKQYRYPAENKLKFNNKYNEYLARLDLPGTSIPFSAKNPLSKNGIPGKN